MPVASSKGARIRYASAGSGPPVLLIQGAGVVGEGWRPQIDALGDRYRLLWFDNRGTGASVMTDDDVSIEAMACDAAAVLDHAGVDRCHLVGHSMGGLIAQQLALTARARVASLALLCTFVTGRDATSVTGQMLMLAIRARVGTRATRRRAFLEMIVPDDVLRSVDTTVMADHFALLFGHDLADQPAFVMRQLRAMGRFDARPRLQQLVGIPTSVGSATLDRIARPDSGRRLAAAIPGATFVEWPRAGHAVPIHAPAVVNDFLSAHFQRASHDPAWEVVAAG